MKKAQQETYDQIVKILDLTASMLDPLDGKDVFIDYEDKLQYVLLLEGFVSHISGVSCDLMEQYLDFFMTSGDDKVDSKECVYDNIVKMLVIISEFQQNLRSNYEG
jgi:hypothetical protein